MTAEQPGVWVTYYWDEHLTIEAVWAEELDALRAANDSAGSKAGFLPYGADAADTFGGGTA
jgi:hypothetical protein